MLSLTHVVKNWNGEGLTETTTRNRIFLAKLVISLSQVIIAENLIRFTDLVDVVSHTIIANDISQGAYGLESGMCGFIAGVLICPKGQ